MRLPVFRAGMLAPIPLIALNLFSSGQPLFAPERQQAVAKMEKFVWGENVLWTDPGDVASLDFALGTGGEQLQPQPPFYFIKEDMGGSNPKVLVRDAKDQTWSVKWSKEAHSDV